MNKDRKYNPGSREISNFLIRKRKGELHSTIVRPRFKRHEYIDLSGEAKINRARELINLKASIEFISDETGLTTSQIKQLK